MNSIPQKTSSTTIKKAGEKVTIAEKQIDPANTGSALFQIQRFTQRIQQLTNHLQRNKKDNVTKRSLIRLVGKRNKMTKYLQRKSPDLYEILAQK